MTFDKVKEIICKELKIEESKVTLEASLSEDLGADSLDAVEVIMALEDEFGVSIPDEEAKEIKIVADIVNFIDSNK
ncbi:MAG: acyl carrier protein [Anaeroplasmataceae bacterium]